MLILSKTENENGARENLKSTHGWQSTPEGWYLVSEKVEAKAWGYLQDGYALKLTIGEVEVDTDELDDEGNPIKKMVEMVTGIKRGAKIPMPEPEAVDEDIVSMNEFIKIAFGVDGDELRRSDAEKAYSLFASLEERTQ